MHSLQQFCRGTAESNGNGHAPSLTRGLGLTLRISGITAFQIFVSFVIQWLVIAKPGLSRQADALYAGGTIPQIVTSLSTPVHVRCGEFG